MDAPHDRDIELQRESGDLIKDLQTKLPPLLWKSASDSRPHRWAKAAKTDKLIALLEPFQEWPQLLDPHLQGLLSQLTGAFLRYLELYPDQYSALHGKSLEDSAIYPLPRAICKLLYVLCKVRGVKVIARFLNNEPKYLEPLLRAFIAWDGVVSKNPVKSLATGQGHPLIWEERYVMLLWLSHLLLAPFDLASISSDDIPVPPFENEDVPDIPTDLPRIAQSTIAISLKYLVLPGKEMEAATSLLARLALRPDMQRLGLLDSLVSWSLGALSPYSRIKHSVFGYIGILSFIARVGSLAQVDDLARHVTPIFDQISKLSPEDPHISTTIKSSATARKLIVKILRTLTTLALSLEARPSSQFSGDQVSGILETAIDHFLVSLADHATPLRLTASKALSLITLKLDPGLGSDVIDAVIGSLDENILYEKSDGTLISKFAAQDTQLGLRKRNISAVDPQQWHGLILTLAHLLFQRSPPADRLGQVLQSLVSGLDFEQRLPTGASIGSNVRDASCFGIWSVARKYPTAELRSLDSQGIKITPQQNDMSTLQTLAVELVCAACLDPSGNIRRGASAALQELIGRHPDTILEGIPLVQVVDYHAVARRSRAIVDVASAAASLGSIYWSHLVEELLRWRGIGSPDSESRRVAALALGTLSVQDSYMSMCIVLRKLREKLLSLSASAVEEYHGCLLSLAATVDAFIAHGAKGPIGEADASLCNEAGLEVARLWEILDSPPGLLRNNLTRLVSRPHLAAEAASRLLSALARSCTPTDDGNRKLLTPRPTDEQLQTAVEILMLCVPREGEIPIAASSKAASDIFALLPVTKQLEVIQRWFDNIHASWKATTGQGQIVALGAVFKQVPASAPERQFIMNQLYRCTSQEEKIAKRVSAVKCLTSAVLPALDNVADLAWNMVTFLDDYTTDRRGDIGSLIRTEAIEGVNLILDSNPNSNQQPSYLADLICCIVRLAAEKLDKVRLHAWKCMQKYWESNPDFAPLKMRFDHFSEVSSAEYFSQLFELLSVDWLRLSLLKGLITSATAGTEGLIRASRFALVEYIRRGDEGMRKSRKTTILKDLVSLLEETMEDDRYAIPAVEILAFLLDSCIDGQEQDLDVDYNKIFVLTQQFHFKSSSMPRLEAATKLYSALGSVEAMRGGVRKKMTTMLLHPYPRVRMNAAENLFMETGVEELKAENWTMPPKHLKPAVEKVKEALAAAS